MNYIHNPADMCCCPLGENNDIYVRAEAVFVDRETNVEIQPGFQPVVGHSYDCVERYFLLRGYTKLKEFKTREEAEAGYADIIRKLRTQGYVFEVREKK